MTMKHMGKVQATVAFIVLLGFFGAIGLVMVGEVNPSMRDALLILIGSLGAAFGAVVNYYFGSSSGSARKDELLADSTYTPTVPMPPPAPTAPPSPGVFP